MKEISALISETPQSSHPLLDVRLQLEGAVYEPESRPAPFTKSATL